MKQILATWRFGVDLLNCLCRCPWVAGANTDNSQGSGDDGHRHPAERRAHCRDEGKLQGRHEKVQCRITQQHCDIALHGVTESTPAVLTCFLVFRIAETRTRNRRNSNFLSSVSNWAKLPTSWQDRVVRVFRERWSFCCGFRHQWIKFDSPCGRLTGLTYIQDWGAQNLTFGTDRAFTCVCRLETCGINRILTC